MEGLSIVKITEENLSYFKPFFFDLSMESNHILLGAVYDGCACGALQLSIKDKAAVMEHFYIADDYRKKGIGTAFMNNVMDTLEGSVYSISATYCSDEEYVHEFLGSFGFIRNKRADAFSVPFSTPPLVAQAPSIRTGEVDGYRLYRQPRSVLMQAQNLLFSHGYKSPIVGKNTCNPQNSFVIFENNKVRGVMINNFHDKDIYVDYITAGDPKSVFKLICLLAYSLSYDKIKPNNIVFLAVSDKSITLIKHLYPDTSINKELSLYDAIYEY